MLATAHDLAQYSLDWLMGNVPLETLALTIQRWRSVPFFTNHEIMIGNTLLLLATTIEPYCYTIFTVRINQY